MPFFHQSFGYGSAGTAGNTLTSSAAIPNIESIGFEFEPSSMGFDATIEYKKTADSVWITGPRVYRNVDHDKWVGKLHELDPGTSYDIRASIDSNPIGTFSSSTWSEPGTRRGGVGWNWNINATWKAVCLTGAVSWVATNSLTWTGGTGTVQASFLDVSGDGWIFYTIDSGVDMSSGLTITNSTLTDDATVDQGGAVKAQWSLDANTSGTDGGETAPKNPANFNWLLIEPSGAMDFYEDERVLVDCNDYVSFDYCVLFDTCSYTILSGFFFEGAEDAVMGFSGSQAIVEQEWVIIDDCSFHKFGKVDESGWALNSGGGDEGRLGAIRVNNGGGVNHANIIFQYCEGFEPRNDCSRWDEPHPEIASAGDYQDGDPLNIGVHSRGWSWLYIRDGGPELTIRYNTIRGTGDQVNNADHYRFDPHESADVSLADNAIVFSEAGNQRARGGGIDSDLYPDGTFCYLGIDRGGGLPSDSGAGPGWQSQTEYYIRHITSGGTPAIQLYDSAANAIAGGATGRVTIDTLGSDGVHTGTETIRTDETWHPNAMVNVRHMLNDPLGGGDNDGIGWHKDYNVYGNYVYAAADDSIEVEGYAIRCSTYRNYCQEFFTMGHAPTYIGPRYTYSNVFKDIRRGFSDGYGDVAVKSGNTTKCNRGGPATKVTPGTEWFITDPTLGSNWSDQSTGTGSITYDATNLNMDIAGGASGVGILRVECTTTDTTGTERLQFSVGDNHMTVRIGTSAGGQEVLSDTVFSATSKATSGNPVRHSLDFVPGASPFYIEFRNPNNNTTVIDAWATGADTRHVEFHHNSVLNGARGHRASGNFVGTFYSRNVVGEFGKQEALSIDNNSWDNDIDYWNFETTKANPVSDISAREGLGSTDMETTNTGTITYSSSGEYFLDAVSDGYETAETGGELTNIQAKHSGITLSKGALPSPSDNTAEMQFGHNSYLGILLADTPEGQPGTALTMESGELILID